MKKKVEIIIRQALLGLNIVVPVTANSESEDIFLYGENGILTSLMLVQLIVKIEEKIEAQEDISIILANEKAFSQNNSPFKSFVSLIEYTNELVMLECHYE